MYNDYIQNSIDDYFEEKYNEKEVEKKKELFIQRVNNDKETENDRYIIDKIAGDYINKDFFETLPEKMNKESWHLDNDDNYQKVRTIYIGSIINPSAKYYMPWCSNFDLVEGKIDEAFWEMIEEGLNEIPNKSYYHFAGEGDPCDTFIGECEEFYSDKEVFTIIHGENEIHLIEELEEEDFENNKYYTNEVINHETWKDEEKYKEFTKENWIEWKHEFVANDENYVEEKTQINTVSNIQIQKPQINSLNIKEIKNILKGEN
jgi:hypothetical protein